MARREEIPVRREGLRVRGDAGLIALNDTLYGVTMAPGGSSQVVSQKVSEPA